MSATSVIEAAEQVAPEAVTARPITEQTSLDPGTRAQVDTAPEGFVRDWL